MTEFHDDENLTKDQEGDSDLVKSLRAQLRNAHRERDGFKKQVEEHSKAARTQSVADLVKAKGLDPDVAQYVPEDVSDKDAFESWLQGGGKLFSKMLAKPEGQADPEPDGKSDPVEPAAPHPDVAALQALQDVEAGGWSPHLAAGEAAKLRALEEAAKATSDPEALLAIMQSGKLDAAVSS